MRIAATVCFVFAAAAFYIALNNIVSSPSRPSDTLGMLGYIGGAMIIPCIFLVTGFSLLNSTRFLKSDDEEPEMLDGDDVRDS